MVDLKGVDMNDNERNTEKVPVDIHLILDDDIDFAKANEYLAILFEIGDRFGELLHDERLTIGEALFVIYMVEKGALGTMDINDPDDISHMLIADNENRMNLVANFIIKNKTKMEEK
jgi:hypothetical protein